MKRQPQNSVFPIIGDHHQSIGLTRREYFAAKAMQAFINHEYYGNKGDEITAQLSVDMADALIKELNKEEK